MKNLKRRKPRRRKQVVPTQPNDIPYSKYRIEWVDALSDSGWADDREFNKMKLAKPINEGWVFSKDKDSVKIFADNMRSAFLHNYFRKYWGNGKRDGHI